VRKILFFFSMLVLFQVSSVYAQTLADYVLEQRGDTLVIKDDFDMGEPNAIYSALLADSVDVPAGRVYMLKTMGYYGIVNSPTTSTSRKVIIVGEDSQLLKTSTNAGFPPVLAGATVEGNPTTGGLTSGLDAEVKNINVELGNSAGNIGWGFFGFQDGARLTVDNCLLEHTYWIMFQLGSNCDVFIKNCYFANMTGYSCRRNGGVIDFFANEDTIWVENTTHIMAQGFAYKTRNHQVSRAVFNHNTFINCSNSVFMNQGFLTNASVTNNIFINCNLQPYSGDENRDPGECDLDPGVPMGFINVANLDSSGFASNSIKFYVDHNLIYWHPIFDDMVSTFNSTAAGGYTTWADQKITMNARTQGYFDDEANFPYLREYNWITGKLPTFANTADLFTDQLEVINTYTRNQSSNDALDILPMWRLINDPTEYFVYADWPIPVDLSYTDADLLTAGTNGFPIGDLNWFPTQFAQWTAQKDVEYSFIDQATQGLVDVAVETRIPTKFELQQNYPNPFNPNTEISFTLPNSGNVTLKVYNALGEQVATLVNGYQEANTYHINFNASGLPSGMYIYTINSDNGSVSKKMMLMK
jgi:hypothetical protein